MPLPLALLGLFALAALPVQSAAPAAAGPARAEQLLQRAAAAAAAVETARHHAVIRRSLLLANRIWQAEGMVSYQRAGPGRGVRLRIEGEVRMPRQQIASPARLAHDGELWSFADDAAQRWSQGRDERLGGDASLLLAGLSLDALLGATPYAGERAVSVRGPEVLSTGEYWVLETETLDGTRSSTWYLASSDLLPRQCDRRTRLDHGEEFAERILHGELERIDALQTPLFTPPPDFEQVEPLSAASLTGWLVPEREREIVVTSLADSLAPLRDAFEAARGKPRVVGLFAPT